MARARLDKIIKAIRGKVGGLIFRLMPDGSIVVSSALHSRFMCLLGGIALGRRRI